VKYITRRRERSGGGSRVGGSEGASTRTKNSFSKITKKRRSSVLGGFWQGKARKGAKGKILFLKSETGGGECGGRGVSRQGCEEP